MEFVKYLVPRYLTLMLHTEYFCLHQYYITTYKQISSALKGFRYLFRDRCRDLSLRRLLIVIFHIYYFDAGTWQPYVPGAQQEIKTLHGPNDLFVTSHSLVLETDLAEAFVILFVFHTILASRSLLSRLRGNRFTVFEGLCSQKFKQPVCCCSFGNIF